jgi:hypothetical protein
MAAENLYNHGLQVLNVQRQMIKLTPWNRVFLEKLTVVDVLKTLCVCVCVCVFSGTRNPQEQATPFYRGAKSIKSTFSHVIPSG